MPCREWKDEWVAQLYDELEPAEERAVAEHLARCAECRATLDGLESVRGTLRHGAAAVPAPTPRVLVLDARRRNPWAVASLLAASVLVFVSGLLIGGRVSGPVATERASATDELATDRFVTRDDLARFESRLASIEGARAVEPAAEPGAAQLAQNVVTDADLRAEIDRLNRKLRGERARDMEFLLDEISAAEWRTGKWIDETRQAVRYVALRDDSRLSER